MSINRRLDKEMWFIYTMEYYTAVKNDTMKFAGKWMANGWMDIEKGGHLKGGMEV